jgi:uncharacterized alpha-E superfamily protein
MADSTPVDSIGYHPRYLRSHGMLSRVADSILWMNRYIERAENVARFIDVNLNLMLDLPEELQIANQWSPLVTTTGDHEIFEKKYGKATQENVIQFLAFDREYGSSITSCVSAARENARSVREVISSEMWEQVNKFYLQITDPGAVQQAADHPHEFFASVKNASHIFAGAAEATMSHNEGWHFGRLGMLMERADKTSRILDVKYFILLPQVEYVGTPYDNLQWSALLKSASALEMYRKRFHTITPSNVATFLILDREFPRAINRCVIEAEASLHAITGNPVGQFSNHAERRLGRLRSELAYAQIKEVIDGGLHEYLDDVQVKINDIGNAVYEDFLAPRPVGSEERL